MQRKPDKKIKYRKFRGWLPVGTLFVFLLLSLSAPLIAPYPPGEVAMEVRLEGPSPEHILGTDALGRDMLSRILYGGRSSMSLALAATVLSLGTGIVLGLIGGYFGGVADWIITMVANIFQGLPGTCLMIAIAGILGPGLFSLLLALILTSWAGFSRIVRTQTLSLREEPFIQGIKGLGASPFRLIFRHILPNMAGELLILFTTRTGRCILAIAALSFLGLGIQPPEPEWSVMINDARMYYRSAPHLLLVPGFCLFILLMAINTLGDSLRDWFDVRNDEMQEDILLSAAGNIEGKSRVWEPEYKKRKNAPIVALHTGMGFKKEGAKDLRVENLQVSFQTGGVESTALDGISAVFPTGKVTGLIGESGCGKSVLSQAVMGLLPRYAKIDGKIWFDGMELVTGNHSMIKSLYGHRIALIPQNPGESLNPVRKIGEQLMEALSLVEQNRPSRKRTAEKILREYGFTEPGRIMAAYPFELSGGMQQRVLCALSTACRPELVIADEPTKGLDPDLVSQVGENLRTVTTSGVETLLVITHDLNLAKDLCQVIAVMYKGQILEMGNRDQVLQQPLHPYTKAFLMAAPENGMQPIPISLWNDGARTVESRRNGISGLIGESGRKGRNGRTGVCGGGNQSGAADEINRGSGRCVFADRCPERDARCLQSEPPEVSKNGVTVKCFLYT